METDLKTQDSSEGEEKVIIEKIEEPDDDIGIYLKEGEFNVEKILDMKVKNGKKQYFVKWEGFSNSQNTWEPAEHLTNIASMIKSFETEYARKMTKNQRQQPKKSEGILTKSKDSHGKKHKASSHLQEEIIVKKIKLDHKTKDNLSEEGAGNALESSNSEKASNFKFDFSDEEKIKVGDNKSHNIQPKRLRSDIKSHKSPKIASKEGQFKKVPTIKTRDKIGSFKNKDKPKEILGIKPGKNNEFFFLVEWEKRSDGIKPENSHISNEEFRIYDSNFLLDFYESKIVIFARKQGKNSEGFARKNEKHAERENVKVDILESNYDMIQDDRFLKQNKKQFYQESKSIGGQEEKYDHQKSESKENDARTLEEIARELDFQIVEVNDNFVNPNSEEDS